MGAQPLSAADRRIGDDAESGQQRLPQTAAELLWGLLRRRAALLSSLITPIPYFHSVNTRAGENQHQSGDNHNPEWKSRPELVQRQLRMALQRPAPEPTNSGNE
jgi:hypothetical protein